MVENHSRCDFLSFVCIWVLTEQKINKTVLIKIKILKNKNENKNKNKNKIIKNKT
jgi:hypothetical protein